MFKRQLEKMVLPAAASVVILVVGMLVTPPLGQAQSDSFDPARVAQGLAIAPVPLKYPPQYKDHVGFGSWLVNAVGDCNGCHTSGTNGAPYPYAVGFNPYFGQQPTKVDPTVYLSGERTSVKLPLTRTSIRSHRTSSPGT